MSDSQPHQHDHEVTIVRESPVLMRVEIVVPAAEVDEELNRALRDLGTKVKMPGFRQGHVPRKLMEQRFGKRVAREVAERLSSHFFFHAVDEHKLAIVAPPVFEHGEAQRGTPLKIVAQVEVKPDFEVKDLEGLTATRSVTTVAEAKVDEQLERLRRQAAQVRTISDRPAAKGDVLRLDYAGTVDGKGDDHMRGADVQVEVGSGRFLPGFEERLVGASRGKAEFDVVVPTDFEREELRGKTVHFAVDVKDILELVLPELDDEFAKDVADEIDSVAALRARIRKELEDAEKDRSEGAVREQVIEQVLSKNPFEVPPALVERYLNAMVEEMKQRLQRRGLSDTEMSVLDPRRLRDEMRPQAQKAAATQLLMETLAKQEKLEVGDEELEAKLEEIAKENGSPVARVRAYYRRDGRFESLRTQVRDEKALALLLARSQITDVPKEP
ncbi:MAG TPA: trigger factor [Myxococcota bacterium]|jgi:trigger factor|nr:trigger factor [Myxococcota bacterium]